MRESARAHSPVEAEGATVGMCLDSELCPGREAFDDLQRPVGRTVVADDQLVGRPRLPGNAAQLFADETSALIGRHGDRYGGFLHRGFKAVSVRNSAWRRENATRKRCRTPGEGDRVSDESSDNGSSPAAMRLL